MAQKTNVVRDILRCAANQSGPVDADTQRQLWQWGRTRDRATVVGLAGRDDLDPTLAAEILANGHGKAQVALMARPSVSVDDVISWVRTQRKPADVFDLFEAVNDAYCRDGDEREARTARLEAIIAATTSPVVLARVVGDTKVARELRVAALERDDIGDGYIGGDWIEKLDKYVFRNDAGLRAVALTTSTHPQILRSALGTATVGDIDDTTAARLWSILISGGLSTNATTPKAASATLDVAKAAASLCVHFTNPVPYCEQVLAATHHAAAIANPNHAELMVEVIVEMTNDARVARLGTTEELDALVSIHRPAATYSGSRQIRPLIAATAAVNPNISDDALVAIIAQYHLSHGAREALRIRGTLGEQVAVAAAVAGHDAKWLGRCSDPDAAFAMLLAGEPGSSLAFEAIEMFAGSPANDAAADRYLKGLTSEEVSRWYDSTTAINKMAGDVLAIVGTANGAELLDELANDWHGSIGDLLAIVGTANAT